MPPALAPKNFTTEVDQVDRLATAATPSWTPRAALKGLNRALDRIVEQVRKELADKRSPLPPVVRITPEGWQSSDQRNETNERQFPAAEQILRLVQDRRQNSALELSVRRFVSVLRPYLDERSTEIAAWNGDRPPSDRRRMTNIGVFRAYVAAYLAAHPGIAHDMTLMVRQLAPGADGLPLEIYCFTATIAWAGYEATQADIFDHLLAVLRTFELRLFQQPTGLDLASALAPAQLTGHQNRMSGVPTRMTSSDSGAPSRA